MLRYFPCFTVSGARERVKEMQERASILCEEKKLSCNTTHYYNCNFFLSDALALYILG